LSTNRYERATVAHSV